MKPTLLKTLTHSTRAARGKMTLAAIVLAIFGLGLFFAMRLQFDKPKGELSSQSRRQPGRYQPTESEWRNVIVEPVTTQSFRSEYITEGKITIDEDRATPIFSPYSGRVTKLFVKPGDKVERGQPLFTVEATDAVQAQNDYIAASAALNKARSALNLAQIGDKRQRDLFEGKAAPLKEVQNARAALDAAENDLQSSQVALEAARNRLRILGKTDREIAEFQTKGQIDAATPIYAPIAGTILQRKIGPGQYIGSGTSDPVFVIGDLSSVWLVAFVREGDSTAVAAGQDVTFTVPANPGQVYSGKLDYVSAMLDPASHRLLVRAKIENPDGNLKPEMFTNVSIFADAKGQPIGVPREALIYEGSLIRAWVARDDRSIELRHIKTGLINGRIIQVNDGLAPGAKVVTKGSLFIDRAAIGS
ncbi:MAG: efflux RND transporter periplasmic adaptor subunit [Xanthobacteraceae bacterium]